MSLVIESKNERKRLWNNRTNPLTTRILLAEDDHEMRALLRHALRAAGYGVVSCRDGVDLLDHLDAYLSTSKGDGRFTKENPHIDLIVSDIRMPGVTGLEIQEGLRECTGKPPMILITAFGSKDIHEQAERLGIAAVFDKPFDIGKLIAKVRQIVPLEIESTVRLERERPDSDGKEIS